MTLPDFFDQLRLRTASEFHNNLHSLPQTTLLSLTPDENAAEMISHLFAVEKRTLSIVDEQPRYNKIGEKTILVFSVVGDTKTLIGYCKTLSADKWMRSWGSEGGWSFEVVGRNEEALRVTIDQHRQQLSAVIATCNEQFIRIRAALLVEATRTIAQKRAEVEARDSTVSVLERMGIKPVKP